MLLLTVATLVAVGVSYLLPEWTSSQSVRDESPSKPAPLAGNFTPGIRNPTIMPADDVDLPDEEPIIGVEVGTHHRAYCIAALTDRHAHVVNDCVDHHPVTVTYCDQTDCTHVFTAAGDEPLDVWMAGFKDGLVLVYNGQFFMQQTGRPVDGGDQSAEVLVTFPHMRTTWKKWHAAHPDTEVYGFDSVPRNNNNHHSS